MILYLIGFVLLTELAGYTGLEALGLVLLMFLIEMAVAILFTE